MTKRTLRLAIYSLLLAVPLCLGQSFKDQVGKVNIGTVNASGPIQVPFIVWGGDMATFYANGGLTTKSGSIFQKQGLNVALKPGDDFVQQVRDYLSGKSPFLRGTVRMMGMASELIASDPRTKGVMVMQLTWSAGDHCVARDTVKSVADLKGKKIVLQQGGPHVGMLDDMLRAASMSFDDVTIVWAKDLTASPNSPAEMFRKDSSIGACFVITPDMLGLNGGLYDSGSGAEGTVKGARVLVSTAELSKSIADVYLCRKDFYDANETMVTKFVAGYIKASEEVIELKKQFEKSGSSEYMKLLKLTQDIYGADVIPTLEEDAHGLLSDCAFVGHPGNIAFFQKAGNLHGFEAKQRSALDLANSLGLASIRAGFVPSPLDWGGKEFIGYLSKTEAVIKPRFNDADVQRKLSDISEEGALESKTIYAFEINFKPNQTEFPVEQFGAEFKKVIELADLYGNAVIAVRGHADPTKTLRELVQAGLGKGVLELRGSKPNQSYYMNGKKINLLETSDVVALIDSAAFDGHPKYRPRETMQAALNLSKKRSIAVRKSIADFAASQGIEMDESQIQPVGVGISEPIISKPTSMAEAEKNMRVEFRVLRVEAEVSETDFDF